MRATKIVTLSFILCCLGWVVGCKSDGGVSPLTKCRVCGSSVAVEATVCPHCGAPMPAPKEVRVQFQRQEQEKRLATLEPEIQNSIGMKLVLIRPGQFLMGSPASENPGRQQQRVRITKPFYMAVHEVTQEQYEHVMGNNPSEFKGAKLPVETVSWEEAADFCEKLSRMEGRTYRLPTQAQWEYACRAGSTTAYSFGDDESQLGAYAWYSENAGDKTHPVGTKNANSWGLYDMHGNVSEWCQDWYDENPSKDLTDPAGPSQGTNRVRRGGAWHDLAWYCRSAYGDRLRPTIRYALLGFRVSLVVPSDE
ncbi:MAG: SUMF1/EgtB/PvdO family nonheme iron enzyme [Anaerolineales bacterium]|nr:SUMF1/EgtB/PvdO family nonheme iron enzyme [Planctomycetales bacterium]NIS82933.1 SUMF1/EgtB/PvdO family nonheme iron enzyme [Anaerolineales bacterium]